MSAQLIETEAVGVSLRLNRYAEAMLVEIAVNDARTGPDLLFDLKPKL